MHKGLVALGIVLLLAGLGASFYYIPHPVVDIPATRIYPYQTVGAALIIAGVLSIALGVYYSPRKEVPPQTSSV